MEYGWKVNDNIDFDWKKLLHKEKENFHQLEYFREVKNRSMMFVMGNSTNLFWHENTVGKTERQKLINQQGCVVWITCLSGSGEVAKLFADAGLICIANLISPYRKDRDACRAMLTDANFIEEMLLSVFMNMPLEVCEAIDCKGLYKLAKAGKIKGFTGIDDPYEPPLNCEIMIEQKDGVCPTPCDMAGQVVSYLDENGFLHA
ncbi:hypothetical protein LXL04_034559 [Taraxacum kok-saghyz]